MELYIIRHGQSTNNALMDDVILRVKDPALTELGQRQAELVGRFLATAENLEQIVQHPSDSPERKIAHPHTITHLYTSAMHRAMQTAKPIGEALGIAPEVWIDIHEHGGIFLEKDGVATGYGGMTRDEILAQFPNYRLPHSIDGVGWWNPDYGKEDNERFFARARRVADALRQRAGDAATKDDRIALVTHGAFGGVLMKTLVGIQPEASFFFNTYNTSITRFDLRDDGAVIMRYLNRVTHLPPDLVT
jgi:2,3-bisphosphoglycerate-dependent phosphoglycerate mutase